MHRYRRYGSLVVALGALAVAGCGGGGGNGKTTTTTPAAPTSSGASSAPAGSTASKLSLTADKTQLKYDKSALAAPAGKVTITMTNPSALPHDVALEGNGVDVKGKIVGQGGTSRIAATLKPGTYTFYCSVDGHRQAGMEGKLTVK